jgi:hypothetical protein
MLVCCVPEHKIKYSNATAATGVLNLVQYGSCGFLREGKVRDLEDKELEKLRAKKEN